jgi:hypothetical protein
MSSIEGQGRSMKAAMYSVKLFERKAFDDANRLRKHELVYIAGAPGRGLRGGDPSLNDPVDAAILATWSLCTRR